MYTSVTYNIRLVGKYRIRNAMSRSYILIDRTYILNLKINILDILYTV